MTKYRSVGSVCRPSVCVGGQGNITIIPIVTEGVNIMYVVQVVQTISELTR